MENLPNQLDLIQDKERSNHHLPQEQRLDHDFQKRNEQSNEHLRQQQQPSNFDEHDRQPDRRNEDRHYQSDLARKNKNRTRTLKQRERHFRYEIIRRGIDPRFSITLVKEILRIFEVPFTALIIAKSRLTRLTSLYIGIPNPNMLHEYEHRTRRLFSTEFYEGFQARQRRRCR